MDDAGAPTLGVGFLIETGSSYDELLRIQQIMGSTEAKVYADAARIEQATSGMVNLSGATGQVTSFGSAATREMQNVARETSRAEKSGEGMVRQLNRQIETFGKTASEIRQMRAELRAVEAEERGLTELAGRIRAASAAMDQLEGSSGRVGATSRQTAFAMRSVALQMPDIVGGLLTGQKPMQVLIQQGSQIAQIGMMAEGGLKGMAAQIARASLVFLPFTAAVVAGAVAIRGLQSAANDGADMKAYAASLGLTQKEIRHLTDLHVTFGDTAKAVFQVAGDAIWSSIGPSVGRARDVMEEWIAWIGTGAKAGANYLIGSFVGAYNLITKAWQQYPAVVGEAFTGAVNAAVDALNALIRKSVEGLNGFIRSANAILQSVGMKLPEVSAPQIDRVNQQYRGAAEKWRTTVETEMKKARSVDYVGAAGSAIIDQARKNARDRIRKQAEDKGYLDPEKGKSDKHAEQMEREARAIEAQIRNLYGLAEAYRVSGAAALIAEARVKAESDAIKKRGDIDEAVARQIRLAIAQRVSDAAKSTAAVREQAAAQEEVNRMVAAGIVPAERAAELVRDRIQDLTLLAAIEAAKTVNDRKGIDEATKALEAQRQERERLKAAEASAKYNAAMFAGADQLDMLREELRLIGATDAARVHALATLKATQEAAKETSWSPEQASTWIKMQVAIADQTEANRKAQEAYNDALNFAADKWDLIARNVDNAARGMADAFGNVGRAIGDVASIYAHYAADRERMEAAHAEQLKKWAGDQAQIDRENAKYAIASATSQIGLFGDMASAAKGFFKEKSAGYKALEAAERVYRAFEMAMSLRAMAQNVAETLGIVAQSAVRATAEGTAGIAAQSKLPFPFNIAAMAATAAALVAAGVAVVGSIGGGGKNTLPKANDGTGTVLGDATAKSESIKRSIDALKAVDTVTMSTSRAMLASLRSIDANIGGLSSLLVRTGNINASADVAEGFKANAIGSALGSIPVIGGILKGLFGTKTKVIGSGLYGGAQSLDQILSGGFDASYYSDVQKKKKLFGITTSTKYSTSYTGADSEIEAQFTLLLKQFYTAIGQAAGPLGDSLHAVENRLKGFTVNIGKIDLQGLTGAEIQEKLDAVFGAAADDMAKAAFPGLERFQKVGEGYFETLTRVSSTMEVVTSTFALLGRNTRAMGLDVNMAIAGLFDSVSDFTSASQAYFEAYYTPAEQTAARAAQMRAAFGSLNLAMPATLEAFRALVEAQDLTTDAGRGAYAALLQMAPAFADLAEAMNGTKNAADVLAERQDLERKLLELQGDTAALRALDLAKLDASNRALQQQVWAVQDAQDAAKAAEQLRDAWMSVGTSIMDEVKRIRGLTGTDSTAGFAVLQGQFNAATAAARAGDQDMAKALPGISQALLKAAADAATSRQELDRVSAQTAASLEATYTAISAFGAAGSSPANTLAAAATAAQATGGSANDNGAVDMAAELKALREELAQMRADMNSGNAAVAANTGKVARILDDVSAPSGGTAISVAGAAA